MSLTYRIKKFWEKTYETEGSDMQQSQCLENWRVAYLKVMRYHLSTSKNDVFLDIGVGLTGYSCIDTSRSGALSVGVDISFEAMKSAKRTAKIALSQKSNLIDFCCCTATNLPFRREVFTKVALIQVLQYIPDDQKAIAEVGRVTRTRGKIIGLVPNTLVRMLPFLAPLQRRSDRLSGFLRRYKAEELITEFAKNNCNCVCSTIHIFLR